MAQEIINIGLAANDGSGDTLRQTAEKINSNFTELFGVQAVLVQDVSDSSLEYIRTADGWVSLDSAKIVRDVPPDGNLYARRDSDWVQVPSNLESPTDGKYYGRISGGWGAVTEEAPNDGDIYVRRNRGWDTLILPFDSDAPSDGDVYGRRNGNWINVSIPPGTEEAPNDGKTYARSSESWVDITDDLAAAAVDEAPIDSRTYGRINTTWSLVTPEAPNDGTTYVRNSTAWIPITYPVNEAPFDGLTYARRDSAWVAATEEAPFDSDFYARVNGAWQKTVGFAPSDSEQYVRYNGDWEILDLSALDAPADSNYYVRDSSTYAVLDSDVLTTAIGQTFWNGFPPAPDSAGKAYGQSRIGWVEVVPEAALDGNTYARRLGGWELVSDGSTKVTGIVSPASGDSAIIPPNFEIALIVSPPGGGALVRLPPDSDTPGGTQITVKRIDDNPGGITLRPNVGQDLEGDSTGSLNLSSLDSRTVVFFESQWWYL